MKVTPRRLTISDELPVTVLPQEACWSENYAFYNYDTATGIGFFAHAGRWVQDPTLWREQLYIYLPDGSFLAHKAIGPTPDAAMPSGGVMRLTYDHVGKEWKLGFRGAMRRGTFEEFRSEPVREGSPVCVSLEATIASQHPVWMLDHADNTTSGRYHYEQVTQCEGHLKFAGHDYQFTGPGYRDHSRGPRRLTNFDGHIWLQIFFPDGLTFSAYQMWDAANGQALDEAVAIDQKGFGPAQLKNSLRLRSLDKLLAPVEVAISMGGQEFSLVGKYLNTYLTSFSEAFDIYFGVVPSIAPFMNIEQPMLFDGPRGQAFGYLQRSMRTVPQQPPESAKLP